MKLKRCIVDKLNAYGVGRRKLDDMLFIHDNPPARLGVYDFDDENLCHDLVITPCNVPGCGYVAESLLEYEYHYNQSHRYTCIECRKVLPSPHFLDLHIQENHDSFFAVVSARRPSYLCYIEECTQRFHNAEERLQHCVDIHKIPRDFRFETKPKSKNRSKKGKGKKSSANKEASMEVDLGINEAAAIGAVATAMDANTTDTTSNTADISEATGSANVNTTPVTGDATNEGASANEGKNKVVLTTSKQKTFHKNKKYTGKKFTKTRTNKNSSVNIDEVMTDLKESLPE